MPTEYDTTDTIVSTNPRGTILKASATQTRFKPTSMWVSLGSGRYLHITGSKNLTTNYDRLNGYTEVVFRP